MMGEGDGGGSVTVAHQVVALVERVQIPSFAPFL